MHKKTCIWLSIVIAVIAVLIISVLIFFIVMDAKANIDMKKLNTERSVVTILDSDGNIFYDTAADFAPFSEIPDTLIMAFVTLEDKRFFNHNGIDTYRMAGAMMKNIKHSGYKEGASTITQQLIKNTHLSNEKTIKRKLSEVFLALKLEKKLSKSEILEKYLNILYFGNSIYGIKSAAQAFFGKELAQLSLSECATIAGVIKSPAKYSPLRNLEGALKRRNTVLDVLLKENKISPQEFNKARLESINIIGQLHKNNIGRAYVDGVLEQASQELGISKKAISQKGLKIETYYNAKNQKIIEDAADANTLACEKNYAFIMQDSDTCGISACDTNAPEGIYSTRKQIGSTIKPLFSYAAALEFGGYSPASIIVDEPVDIGGYSPKNYADNYLGNITLRDALCKSSNSVAVRLAEQVGVEKCNETARNLGLSLSKTDTNLATSLGGTMYGIDFISLLNSYSTISRGGIRANGSFIKSIKDDTGKILYTHNASKESAVSPQTAFLLADMLKTVSQHGTAKRLAVLPFEVASKTGTVSCADESFNSDVFNLSFTTQNSMLIWVGGDKDKGFLDKSQTGASLSSMIAKDIYENIYPSNFPPSFVSPDGICSLEIDKYSLYKKGEILLASKNQPQQFLMKETFNTNNAPKQISTVFDPPKLDFYLKQVIDKTVYISFFSDVDTHYTILKKQKKAFLNFVDYPEIIVTQFYGDNSLSQVIDTNGNKNYEYFIVSKKNIDGIEILGEKCPL